MQHNYGEKYPYKADPLEKLSEKAKQLEASASIKLIKYKLVSLTDYRFER